MLFAQKRGRKRFLASRSWKENRKSNAAADRVRRGSNRFACNALRRALSGSDMTALQTTRLNLRPFSEDDLDDLSILTANPDFMRFSLGVYSREQTIAFLEKVRGRDREGLPTQFALVFRPTGKLIGFCGFFVQTVDEVDELEIAYRLDPSYWGRGLATEAARAVRDHAFNDLLLSRVISLIHPDNVASRRVAEKNGMVPEKETLFRGFPTIVFGINREQRKGR
jgi:ribosomal-protein-alanine N-acetyltransferase